MSYVISWNTVKSSKYHGTCYVTVWNIPDLQILLTSTLLCHVSSLSQSQSWEQIIRLQIIKRRLMPHSGLMTRGQVRVNNGDDGDDGHGCFYAVNVATINFTREAMTASDDNTGCFSAFCRSLSALLAWSQPSWGLIFGDDRLLDGSQLTLDHRYFCSTETTILCQKQVRYPFLASLTLLGELV